MKQVVFYALAAGLVLSTGCSKKSEDGTTEKMPATEAAVKPQQPPVKATAQAATITAQAEAVTKQATAAVTAMKVKAEDVMADLNKSVEQVKEKAAGFDTPQLTAYADSYKDVIIEKKNQLANLADQLKSLNMTEMVGEKGKAIKNQLSQYTSQLSALKERYSVYLDQLKAFGIDVSAYGL